jgi:hypothetical protein
MRMVAAALRSLLVAILATGASAVRADLLDFLDGDARPIAATTLFAAPGARAASFWLFAGHPDRDLRTDPGALVLFTASGVMVAEADAGTRRFGHWRFDTVSGRPLRPDASSDAGCATGQEPACWRPGDPVPYSSEVADALETRIEWPAPRIASAPNRNQQLFATICATSIGFSASDRGSCGTQIALPVVPLNTEPAEIRKEPTSQLSDEEQALLGCGPFWGTECATDGIDLGNADTSVLTQSWVAPERTPTGVTLPPGFIRLPGSLAPGNPIPSTCTPGSVGFCSGGYASSGGLILPYGGNLFSSEMAALSFNFQNLLVAFSGPVAPKGEPTGSSDYDPADPFSRAPRQCSFVQPQYCASIRALYSLATTAQSLDDDPGGSGMHWIWEAGAEYRVIEASGEFADYAGGRVHVLGVERSRTRRASLGIPVALFPAPGATLAPEAPFAMPAADPTAGVTHGLAYLTIPEPSGAALAAAAIAALTLLARISASRPA